MNESRNIRMEEEQQQGFSCCAIDRLLSNPVALPPQVYKRKLNSKDKKK